MPLAAPIPQDRPLTDQEAELVRWLLENGKPDAASFLTQLPLARVVTQCDCGCASINFAIARVLPPVGAGMLILADYSWEATDRLALGVFVFSCGGLLAGLEVWSAGEMYVPPSLPAIEVLRSLVVS